MSAPPPRFVIRAVRTREDVRAARGAIRAYERSLDVDLCFQGFDAEMKGLPGDYAPPSGDLWLARDRGHVVGVVALRRLGPDRAEMKRLFVARRARGYGLGRRLADRVVRTARARGYRWVYLDTLSSMTTALHLYRSMGFRATRPYRYNPVRGSRFLRLRLR